MEYLYEKLRQYEKSGHYGFHMPGHKRSSLLTGADLPYGIDITEIAGFDDLHHARGIIKEAQERAARVYCAGETHYLINGSTVGILSAILGCTSRGDRILMARNCHRSVYNAVFLNDLQPVYIYPELGPCTKKASVNGEISALQVEEMLEAYPDIRAVVLTSPTYDGIVSDVRSIAECVHRKKIPMILDEAHGAHFGFHSYFPANGNELGADIVIHSLHKTMPSLTQTALLHMNGDIIDRSRVRMYLHILQSSSPSYVLMASIDECIRVLEQDREKIFDRYAAVLEGTRQKLGGLRHLRLLETKRYDRSKLLFLTDNAGTAGHKERLGYTGKQLYHELNEKYMLQMEMAGPYHVIAMTSPCDSSAGMESLIRALTEIDGKLSICDKNAGFDSNKGDIDKVYSRNEQIYSIGEIYKFTNKTKTISISECGGCISTEYAYIYPPGIPLIVPGERISGGTVQQLMQYAELGFEIEGLQTGGKIEVLDNG